ncbi:sacsin-like [Mercenaria mercenaria]|uniref:sacsin-like n=1 Tax=Mercenaria mercenaria TaxID=6596 RepID=UPI00234F9184|nr:sacsin-like [Mercenaria mercenaria]
MEQPPLIKQLKGILSDYPDGGQILKELIQNAEDAGASEVKILYDGRRINCDINEETPTFTKFFKGPALCVYNNEVFKEHDWKGIKMIYSSMKEEDPLKVGRFGLGFKSVFHITDYPCVISGKMLLLIDPQRSEHSINKVNAMIEMSDVRGNEDGLDSEAFWTAFDGTFGLCKDIVEDGYFPGTVFWFPLREIKSELSETLYDEDKVMTLFQGFEPEASSILIFLKNLEMISLSTRKSENIEKTEEIKVEIENISKVRQQRREFKTEMDSLISGVTDKDVSNTIQMNVCSTVSEKSERTEWLIVNYFVGSSASSEFKRLINDSTLGYSPYVGVAIPLNQHEKSFAGHIFCFLPLPREGIQLTGLPIHVNGFFALSQNRHHLKWETDELHGKKIDDKSIRWNQFLIKDALPNAYSKLIESTIQMSNDCKNTEDSIERVYNCLPRSSKTAKRWTVLEIELFNRLKGMQFLFSESKNTWVYPTQATFATFRYLPSDVKYVQQAVVKCLSVIGCSYVRIQSHLFDTLVTHIPELCDLNSDSLATLLRKNTAYKEMSKSQKSDVLLYLFSFEEKYENLKGIELLPVSSGEWKCFHEKEKAIYSCPEEAANIFPGLENRVLADSSLVGFDIFKHLKNIAAKGLFQIKDATPVIIARLLKATLSYHIKSGTDGRARLNETLTISWLQNVWQFLKDVEDICLFDSTDIVPVLRRGTWEAPQMVDLVKLSDFLVLKSYKDDNLPDGVCKCFETLGVTILPSLPAWIPKDRIKPLIFWPTEKGVIRLFQALHSSKITVKYVSLFNQRCTWNDKQELVSFLVKCQFHLSNNTAVRFLKQLNLFQAVDVLNGNRSDSSVLECGRFINCTEFPENVRLPYKCLVGSSDAKVIMKQLGAEEVNLECLVKETLKCFIKRSKKHQKFTVDFMEYFISRFSLFETNSEIVKAASDVSFLKAGTSLKKPSELFDPSELTLHDLLLEELMLPEKILTENDIQILKVLGLKSQDHITADIILKVAISLDRWTKEGTHDKDIPIKANAFMKILALKQDRLNNRTKSGKNLKTCLNELYCIPLQSSRVSSYPACFEWFSQQLPLAKPKDVREVSLCHLIGGTMPTTLCTSEQLNKCFHWKEAPPMIQVLDQLKMATKCYSVNCGSMVMQSVRPIYEFIHDRLSSMQEDDMKMLSVTDWIWTGSCFASPKKTIIERHSDDLDLRPYFYTLPAEFSDMYSLYISYGCIQRQDTQVLLDTLNIIQQTKHESDEQLNQDRQTVRNVLEKIAASVKEGSEFEVSNILMMVCDKNPKSLTLLPASECTYNDDPTCCYDDDDSVHIVHEMIPESTARAMGVKSRTQKLLFEAEELDIQECGQEEQLTARIHSLLEGYADGLSVPKELIQNADDAGASVVKFLYDERQNCHCKQKVFSEEMKDFQGPALFVYNDKSFTQADLDNIQKLNGATKLNDQTKIGKFGLGFCSVYNLTDLPSFITGSNVIFFDPHKRNLGRVYNSGRKGLRFKLPNKTLSTGFSDQLMPYNEIFGCNIFDEKFTGLNGTLFRFPLRTKQQARESQICSIPYTKDEMKQLLEMFIKTAGNMLIFSQNVKKLEIFHIVEKDTTASNMQLIYEVEKTTWRMYHGILEKMNQSVLARVPEIMKSAKDFQEIHKTVVKQTLDNAARKSLSNFDDFPQSSTTTTWLISWAKGEGQSMDMYRKLSMKGAIPLSAVAIPCDMSCDMQDGMIPCMLDDLQAGFYKDGHAFCFLPLPIKTKLPVQINGCFTVTSDRRQLVSHTEDDKNSTSNAWNNAVMEDALVKAQVQLLELLASTISKNDNKNSYFDFWPDKCSDIALPFKESFYRYIFKRNIKVFHDSYTWFSFQDVIYLDPQLRKSAIGNLAFEVVTRFKPRPQKTLVDMPEFVINALKQSNKTNEKRIKSSKIGKRKLFMLFLKEIHNPFWQNRTNDRNKLIIAALYSSNEEVRATLINTRCIPTEPDNILRKPSQIIHPKSELALLFHVNEGYFPLDTEEMRSDEILTILVTLGMNDKRLSDNFLLDRCESVARIANDCCSCSYDRCVNVLGYLSLTNVLTHLQDKTKTLKKIKDINMLPVLPRPKTWLFPWKSESTCCDIIVFDAKQRCDQHKGSGKPYILGKPNSLYQDNCKDFVGMVECIADEGIISSLKPRIQRGSQDIVTVLGIKSLETAPLHDIVGQTELLIEQYKEPDLQYDELQRIHRKLFDHFEDIMKAVTENSVSNLNALISLKNKNVVLIGKHLIHTSKVAFEMKTECKPFLYRLSETDIVSRKSVYKFLGVKTSFDIDDILEVIKQKHIHWGENIENDIEEMNILLILLDDLMTSKGNSYAEFPDKHDLILAPDNHCELYPTYKLVIENEEFETSDSMKVLHPSISAKLAFHLGVKAKEERCFEDMSVGISFGQREKLETRIHNLLQAYPCDSSIMKELLQNADDAGATEINFIKDYRDHSTDRTFGSPLLQGPALCVFNNSSFTQEDIVGIHNLGKGSKSQDPTKTGQYGVGFNAVYHLTDTPSFLTKGPELDSGGRLCILDPLCKYVPKATEHKPGQMCKVDLLKRNFPNSLLGYSSEQLLKTETGTVFRFPLRKAKSGLSIQEEVSTEQMDIILSDFIKEMFHALIFLKNVSCIKVSNLTSGTLVEEYSVKTEISQNAALSKQHFLEQVQSLTKVNKEDKSGNLDVEPSHIMYEMQIEDNEKVERFLVVQMFGLKSNKDIDEIKVTFQKKQFGQIPLGGIACPLSGLFVKDTSLPVKKKKTSQNKLSQTQTSIADEQSHFKGKAFCILPLPIHTGFPVHINGHFILDHEARRDVCKDGDGRRWNDFLMENNIVPAWHLAIEYLQSSIESAVLKSSILYRMHNWVIKPYYDKFPKHDDVHDSIWRNLLKMFYVQAVETKCSLFPLIIDRCFQDLSYTEATEESPDPQASQRFCISWTYVNMSENSFQGVFDDIKSYLKTVYSDWKTKQTESIALGNILRNLGMQLITSPSFILESILKAEIKDIPTASPEYVVHFLKSFDKDYEGHCDIGNMGDKIESTRFKTEHNLCRIFNYITLYKEYTTALDGLPVLLTADNVLRVISKSASVFVTPYWKLLKDTGQLFLHDDIQGLILDRALFDAGYFKDFTTNDFLKLLPQNLSVNEFGTGKIVTFSKVQDMPLSKEWLGELYDFLCDRAANSSYTGIDYELFNKNLQLLGNWSFLPTQQKKCAYALVPFSKSHHVFHLTKSYETDQIKLLLKIDLPHIDKGSFSYCRASPNARSALKRYVATPENPTALLHCLIAHRTDIEQCKDLSSEDGIVILSFFERHLDSIAENCENNSAKDLLKQLPFYLTLHGTLTSLKEAGRLLILPSGIPLDGIKEWACKYKTTLIQKIEGLNKLYKFLELKTSSILSIYGESILPTFGGISEKHWLVHITYLRDNLRNCLEFDAEQSEVIQKLKHLAFIDSNGRKKRVSELYLHKNEVFLQLLDETDFLPEELRGQEWERFLEILGLNAIVTDELMLRFAREIQAEGLNIVSDLTEQKSNSLVQSLQHPPESGWKKKTLKVLKDIRFVVPHTIDSFMSGIFRQVDNALRLIPFNQSVSATEKNITLCWSSVCLIPSDVCEGLSQADRSTLGLLEEPTIGSVVKHCQNICEPMKKMLEDNNIKNTFVATQMFHLYNFFNSQKTDVALYQEQLQVVPIIHLYEETKMCPSSQIVIDLQSIGEVKPYLYRAPVHYGMYHNLFEKFGSQKTASFEHYIRILQQIKNKVKDDRMTVSELHLVERSLRNMVQLLDMTKENKTEIDRLYLPNSRSMLVNATSLTVSNNKLLERRLDKKVNIDYFMGFPALKIDINDPVPVFKRLPDHLQPSFLTKVVREVISEDKMQILECSRNARQIERIFHADEFANAICRLVKHQMTCSEMEFTETHASGIRKKLLSVHALRVEGLQTVLYYRDTIVAGSERRKLCFHQSFKEEESDQINFYFLDNEEDDGLRNLISCNDGLAELVDVCTNRILDKFAMRIVTTLMSISDFQRFSEFLDESNVDAYDVLQGRVGSIFPKPGTYVESRFLPFLEQGIQPFEEYEFESVAMELEDALDFDENTDQEPIFIYVHIMQEIKIDNITSDIKRVYVVDTGDPYRWSETVPIYRLYRFVRKENHGSEVQMFDEEADYKLPLDENCRRIRAILRDAKQLPEEEWKKIKRRLLLKWHPDKNFGKEVYCTKVFQYLKIVISRLENGEDIGDDIDEEMKKGPSGPPTTDYYKNINKRARKHGKAFRDNFEDYKQSYRHKSKSEDRENVRDPREAIRWMRQAKKDFESAEEMFSVVQSIPGFNWICYTCHQASEKSLKAAWFYKDANLTPRSSHSLISLASGLNKELREQAALLENRLGQHTRMRYPDSVSRPKIPSDIFDEAVAKFSIEVTRKIIKLTEEYIR